MSHDRGWRAACRLTMWILRFHFEIGEIARGVTAMVVGSGALLGRFRLSDFDLLKQNGHFMEITQGLPHTELNSTSFAKAEGVMT